MKLTEFDNTKSYAAKALKENYSLPFNSQKLDMSKTSTMLRKVRGMISETKASADFYVKQTSPQYMQLVFMEQALAQRFVDLQAMPEPRIVVENEEVEKSQVVLAAQDLVDSIQKMLEDVGQMQVKELPALVSSIESEIGVNESQQYDQEVSQQLDQLSTALKDAFTGLKNALGTVTGQGVGAEAFDSSMDLETPMGDEEVDIDVNEPESDMGDDLSDIEPPEEPLADIGRAKR